MVRTLVFTLSSLTAQSSARCQDGRVELSRFGSTQRRATQATYREDLGFVPRRRSMMPSAERSSSSTVNPRARTRPSGSRSK